MEKITAYVPCYNAADTIVPCLEGLLAQSQAPEEVLVIDDGSRDDTVRFASRYPRVRVVRHQENRGLGAARNTAFRDARQPWVAAVDADCVPQPHWLETLARRVSKRDVAGAGGRLVETGVGTLADRWRRAHLSQDWGLQPVLNPPFLFGNNTLLRRDAILQSGGYGEQFRTNGEDADLSRRLRQHGFLFAYEPEATVHHLRRDHTLSILNMFCRYREGHQEPVPVRAVWRNWRSIHFGRARAALRSDLRRGRYDLTLIDFLLFVFPVWWDLKKAWKRNGSPAQNIWR